MIGQERLYYEEVESTNNVAKKWAKAGAASGSLVIAEKQLAGKGRNGKVWDSPKGVGIWMSVILRPQVLPKDIPQLALVAGLAICHSIQKETGLEAYIKWPNDIVIQGKKVCGILCEMQADRDKVNYCVVGIGVNVNTVIFSHMLPHASSLYLMSGYKQNKESIIASFCDFFNTYYTLYENEKGLSSLLYEYKKYCITLESQVKIEDSNGIYEAYVLDINEEGHLIVELADGTIKEILAGEVSVRGLYGYI